MLVFLAFKSHQPIPWQLKNRWDDCMQIISSMNFIVSHIYREENHCADNLANIVYLRLLCLILGIVSLRVEGQVVCPPAPPR